MNKKLIFVSCGQQNNQERDLGLAIKNLIDNTDGYEGYFAQDVSSLEALTNNIFKNIKRCAGCIAILHPRGVIGANGGHRQQRSSVWVNQEIAIEIPILVFKDPSVALEGAMQYLIVNSNPIPSSMQAILPQIKEWLRSTAFPDLQSQEQGIISPETKQEFEKQIPSAEPLHPLVNKIKSKGYLKVGIYPSRFVPNRISSLAACKKIIQDSNVSLRGWDYPHWSRRDDDRQIGHDWIQGAADFLGNIEVWRFYQSGQFVHYSACREDWERWETNWGTPPRENEKWLNILSTLYWVTEIFEFASRLCQKAGFGEGVHVSIELHGMEGRRLKYAGVAKISPPNCVSSISVIYFENDLPSKHLTADAHKLALDFFIHVLESFGWDDHDGELKKCFAKDQVEFLKR
ncbi:MAG: hypothetical protein HY747_05425 [Elusimicrobia bacterium]|nr:hypothetical protein [Elusimicrobiota bacterium]